MSIDMVKPIYAEDVEVGDQLDFADDEYGWNDEADFGFAEVLSKKDWYAKELDELYVTLITDQGTFDMPAAHRVKRKIDA